MGNGERERGARSGPGTLPPLPPSGGNPTVRSGVADRPYASTNSGPAAPARRSMSSLPPRPLPPPPLALDHPPQRLTAGRTAEPLTRAPLRGCEVGFTPRTVAARKSGIVGWALALAPRLRTSARGVRPRGTGRLGFGRSPALGAATPVPPALAPTVLLAVGRPPILSAGPPAPPPPRRRATLGTTVPGLRVGRSEGLLAPLEQTPPLSRPTRPLTGSRWAMSLEWAQGSGKLPTAKPRTRSPLCSAPRRLL